MGQKKSFCKMLKEDWEIIQIEKQRKWHIKLDYSISIIMFLLTPFVYWAGGFWPVMFIPIIACLDSARRWKKILNLGVFNG